MDLILALWILLWDCVIVTFSVAYAIHVGKKARAEAIALRDDAVKQAREIRADLQADLKLLAQKLDAIEIPEIPEDEPLDFESIKADLRDTMTKSLGGYMGNVQKELNDMKDKIDKALAQIQQGGSYESPAIGDKLLVKMLDKFM